MLKKIDSWIKIRNRNYLMFTEILKKYNEILSSPFKNSMSSFVLPFLMKNKKSKVRLEALLDKNGIESRPFIAGNLLKQPFLSKYKNKDLQSSDFIENNCFYIGNNQFVQKNRLIKLSLILSKFFNKN